LFLFWLILYVTSLGVVKRASAEAMLELFNVSWSELTARMPEIAEAGYDSLWLPNPAKGNSGTFSVGYDQFDPFDLGNKNQAGTIATRYGTEAELVQMVQTAHRFGIRVYFDNVMNHRASVVPGFNSSTPTNYYPGLIPQDFHLQTVSNYLQNWPQVSNFCDQWQVQNQSLLGLVDLAQEPGNINVNFGPTLGSSITKPRFIRHPNNPDYYMNTNGPPLGGPWFPFNGNGQPVPEDVGGYLCRAVMWTLYTTKCDGFRLDAAKHVPSPFFGANSGGNTFNDDPSFSGYTGAIQAMYDYTHGYGNNATGNGYIETDGNRNSLFNTETPRNDAMIFGEHVSPVPDYQEYLEVGMRLCNQPLYNQFNAALSGNAGLQGMDGRDYAPPDEFPCGGTAYPCYSAAQSVMFPQTQDGGTCCPVHQELQDVYYFMHEGLPMVYSDGFNHSGPPDYFPAVSYADFLGEFGNNQMPDLMYLHNQLARGGTWPRWSDQNIIAFERYDYRESTNSQDQDVVLFAMNDNFGYPGDTAFDDGVTRESDGYYGGIAVSNSRNLGLAVGFPPGSVLAQLSSTAPGGERSYAKLLVHAATSSLSAAQSTANDPTPQNRAIYVGSQSIPSGGGAIEFSIPSGGWVLYGYQWPEASRANPSTNAIILRQGGVEVPRLTVLRSDGANGDTGFNPLYPFKMAGRVDPYGNVITGQNVSNLTYAIDIPIVTNAPLDIIARCDASCSNILIKLDGGIDLNSQMGLGPISNQSGIAPTNILDLRDNKPGYAWDVFLGYEQSLFQFRNGPEKFAARNTLSNNIVSLGAETYYYTIGGTNTVVSGSGYGENITDQTATWVYHDPAASVTSLSSNPPTQLNPSNPATGQSADVWIKVGYQFQINTGFIYYTTDGSNPEGAFGAGKGTTHVVQAHFVNHDSAQENIDWWKGTIPGQAANIQVRYKAAFFYGGSASNSNISPIPDAEPTGAKLYGLTQFAITNFNPVTALVWQHNDLNAANTYTGLQGGFHILRARTFLTRPNQSSVYNTFIQTFYYDAALPTGTIAFPPTNSTISTASYTVVVRADSTVTGVDFSIQDSDPSNDDSVTGQANGNGPTNFVAAAQVRPDPTLDSQYPAYPQEFRFNYLNVPTNGVASIIVRLKEYSSSVYTNRLTMLTNIVNTAAPTEFLTFFSPQGSRTILTPASNTLYLVQACFSSNLPSVTTNFSLFINGALQPSASYILRPVGAVSGCAGMKSFLFNWNVSQAAYGSNVLQLYCTNGISTLSATTSVIVAPPLRISGLAGNDQLVVWDSAPGINYQVLATTNLSEPFVPISPVIPATTASTVYFDTSSAPEKFYIIQVVQ
jgi:hypothetical protein